MRDAARTFGVHRRFPAAASHDAPFGVDIGGAHLAHDGARGALTAGGHELAWDLRWRPADAAMRLLPDLVYARVGLGETTVRVAEPARRR